MAKKHATLSELFMNIKLMISEFFFKFICCILKKKNLGEKRNVQERLKFLELHVPVDPKYC